MKKLKLTIVTIVLVIFLIITQTGCKEIEPVNKSNFALDTICNITIYDMEGMSEEKARDTIDGAYDLVRKYENKLSKTIEKSDIYQVNKNGSAKVDRDTLEVLKKGIYFGELSDGKFDITIGKVTDLWDFHGETPKVPENKNINEALKAVNYKQIKIEDDVVTLDFKNGEIDLGGIAKGYIADKVTEYLVDKKVNSAIIDLGGNIVAIGGKPNGDDFNIGIERPFTDRSEIVGAVPLKDKTVVTSGIYERNFTQDGKLYHHILDVKTGYPADTDVEAVTIITDRGSSVDGDGLSTTCLMLGVEKGKKLIESLEGIEALFIDKDDNITMTDGMIFNKMEK